MQKMFGKGFGVCCMVFVVALVALCGVARAEVDTVLDWDEGIVATIAMTDPEAQNGRTSGQRLVLARTAAQAMAEADLLGAIMGMKINRRTTVRQAILSGDLIEKKVEGFIKGAMVIEEGINELNLYEVSMAVRIEDVLEVVMAESAKSTGDAYGLVGTPTATPRFKRTHKLNKRYLGLPDDEPAVTARRPAPRSTYRKPAASVPESKSSTDSDDMTLREYMRTRLKDKIRTIPGKETAEKSGTGSGETGKSTEPERIALTVTSDTGYTSLVIDGRLQNNLIKGRRVVIYTKDGKVLYKGDKIHYFNRLLDALRSDVAGSKPLVVDAVNTKRNRSGRVTYPVVSKSDGHRIRRADDESSILKNPRIIILVK